MNLAFVEAGVKDELHSNWLRSPFTDGLLNHIQLEINQLDEQLDKFAASNCQDVVRITNTINRRLVLNGIVS